MNKAQLLMSWPRWQFGRHPDLLAMADIAQKSKIEQCQKSRKNSFNQVCSWPNCDMLRCRATLVADGHGRHWSNHPNQPKWRLWPLADVKGASADLPARAHSLRL